MAEHYLKKRLVENGESPLEIVQTDIPTKRMTKKIILTAVASLLLISSGCHGGGAPSERAPASVEIPNGLRTAVLGAGCFWCLEVFYEEINGVHQAISGYAGGSEPDPSYEQVAQGKTSHAEVIQVIYDPAVVTYRDLIDFFWTTHDATRNDGVWPDFGPQYRSILLYQNDDERAVIETSRITYEAKIDNNVATEIKAFDAFYPAEIYHQDYAKKNPDDRYVRGVLEPKLKKLGLAE